LSPAGPTREAFELWQAGRLDEAAASYRAALADIPADHFALGEIHGELAAVLQTLGDHDGALVHLQAALAAALRDDGDADVGVVIARYFLADHLHRRGRAEDALATIAPSLVAGTSKAWLLHLVEAECLHALGRVSEASAAVARALVSAPTEEGREKLRARFAEAGLPMPAPDR
jgi:tetratricopeptide (TPR) repeat protein